MSQQNKQTSTSAPTDFPVKRKRGRPRKDDNLVKKPSLNLPVTPPAPDDMKRSHPVNVNQSDAINDEMVGRVVSGVIEGTFDAGYFLSVRVGNTGHVLRGVVFQTGLFTPITAANDVAQQAKMYQRLEVPIPVCNPQCEVNGFIPHQSEQNIKQHVQLENQEHMSPQQGLPFEMQSHASLATNNQSSSILVPVTDMPKNESAASLGGKIILLQNPEFGFQKQSAPSLENLKLVEQDEVMQVFEASNLFDGPKTNVDTAKVVALESTPGQRVNALSGNEAINKAPQVQNEAVESKCKKSMLVHSELKCPNVEPMPPASQSVESEFEPKESVPNELKGSNLEFPQVPLVSISPSVPLEPETVDYGLRPSESLHNELKSPNLDVPQTPVVALPQSVPSGSQAVEFGSPGELIHNELKKPDLKLHQNPLVPANLINETMEINMEKAISPKTDVLHNMQLVPAAKEFRNDGAFKYSKTVSDGGYNTVAKTGEAMPFIPEPATASLIPGRFACSTDLDSILADAIPPTQSYSHPCSISESKRS